MPVRFKTEQQEREFAIDDKYQYLIDEYKWHVSNSGYVRKTTRELGVKATIQLHRHILGLESCNLEGLQTDHVNGNRLDNRVKNLRTATPSQNSQNRPATKSNTSGFKGVTWHDRNKSWRARIGVGRKEIFLGYYQSPKEASEAYLAATQKYHGEFSFENRQLLA